MDGNSKGCPNCGHNLVIERNDVQPAGSRQVRLSWFICPQCRHVALGEWEFVGINETRATAQVREGG